MSGHCAGASSIRREVKMDPAYWKVRYGAHKRYRSRANHWRQEETGETTSFQTPRPGEEGALASARLALSTNNRLAHRYRRKRCE